MEDTRSGAFSFGGDREPPLREAQKRGSHFASMPMGARSREARAKIFAHCANTPYAPPEQANPNCFVTKELFGFVFYFDYHIK